MKSASAGSPQNLSSLLRAVGPTGHVLSLGDHRHRTYVTFMAVLSVNMLQHCVSGLRSGVSNVSVGVLHTLSVSAGETDEGRALTVSFDAVHHSWSVHNAIRYQCEQDHMLW
jgi:hypothetical protein